MTPHARLVAVVEALATKRAMDPLRHLDVVSSEEFLALVAADTPRVSDWIDDRMAASIAGFAHPLTTRAARHLYAAGMRRREVTHG